MLLSRLPLSGSRPCLTAENVQRGFKKTELDELGRNYKKEKNSTDIETWECEWWRPYKTISSVKEHIREKFPHRRSLAEHQLLQKIKAAKLFGYNKCDIEFPTS